jgi:hypothetical protein
MDEMGTVPEEINRYFASEVQNHEVPNFSPLFLDTHTLKWAGLLTILLS